MRTTGPFRLRVGRRIDADPTTTALLLAGPAARELWPGVPTSATVLVEPPRRTPTAFRTRFAWTGPELPAATGVLTLTYAPDVQGTPSTAADLVLDVEPREPGELDDAGLHAVAEGFLANLARAASDRRAA